MERKFNTWKAEERKTMISAILYLLKVTLQQLFHSPDTPDRERRSAPIRGAPNESVRFIHDSIYSHCIRGISQAWFLHFLVHRRLEV